jgi:hypothetical protein
LSYGGSKTRPHTILEAITRLWGTRYQITYIDMKERGFIGLQTGGGGVGATIYCEYTLSYRQE